MIIGAEICSLTSGPLLRSPLYSPKLIELSILFYGFLSHISRYHPDSIIYRDWWVEPVVDEILLQLRWGVEKE